MQLLYLWQWLLSRWPDLKLDVFFCFCFSFEEKPGYMGQPNFKIVMSRPGKVMYYNKIHNSTEDSPRWTETFAFFSSVFSVRTLNFCLVCRFPFSTYFAYWLNRRTQVYCTFYKLGQRSFFKVMYYKIFETPCWQRTYIVLVMPSYKMFYWVEIVSKNTFKNPHHKWLEKSCKFLKKQGPWRTSSS